MAIKSGLSEGVKSLLVQDNVISLVENRIMVTALNSYNTSANDITIDFYISPDDTSASGKKVATVIVETGKDKDTSAIIGEGYNVDDRIIAVPTATGINLTLTYMQFIGGDV
jgi:biotin-(acetyl-CoA carboxylase) ligase